MSGRNRGKRGGAPKELKTRGGAAASYVGDDSGVAAAAAVDGGSGLAAADGFEIVLNFVARQFEFIPGESEEDTDIRVQQYVESHPALSQGEDPEKTRQLKAVLLSKTLEYVRAKRQSAMVVKKRPGKGRILPSIPVGGKKEAAAAGNHGKGKKEAAATAASDHSRGKKETEALDGEALLAQMRIEEKLRGRERMRDPRFEEKRQTKLRIAAKHAVNKQRQQAESVIDVSNLIVNTHRNASGDFNRIMDDNFFPESQLEKALVNRDVGIPKFKKTVKGSSPESIFQALLMSGHENLRLDLFEELFSYFNSQFKGKKEYGKCLNEIIILAVKGNRIDVLEILIKYKVNLDRDLGGKNILHFVGQFGNLATAQFLLEGEVDYGSASADSRVVSSHIDVADSFDGSSPAHDALCSRNFEVLEYFVDHKGADLTRRILKGKLDIVARVLHGDMSLEDKLEALKYALEKGCGKGFVNELKKDKKFRLINHVVKFIDDETEEVKRKLRKI